MPQVKDIKILNFDQKSFSVEDMSNEIQTLVALYNKANRKEADLTDEVLTLRIARDGLLNQIRVQFEAEQKAAAEKAAANQASADKAASDKAAEAAVEAATAASVPATTN